MFFPQNLYELRTHHEEIITQLKKKNVPEILQIFKSDVNAIILYGSHARGDYNWQSDVDLIIISNKFSGIRKIDRSSILDDVFPLGNVEIICFTKDEFKSGLNQGNLTIIEALDYGQIIFEQDHYFSNCRILFQQMLKKGIIKKTIIAGKEIWKI